MQTVTSTPSPVTPPSPPRAAIELVAAGARYGDRAAVRAVSFAIAPGETFVLVGPSGCGKSTTLKMINRLIEPSEGRVLVGGRDVREVDAPTLRRGIGYVIQDAGLFAHHTVRRNVALVPTLLGWDPARVRARVDALLAMVGLPPGEFADRYPRELSGGQRQRVGIARALAGDPPIVLLDEPFGALDPITREHLQGEFLALSARLGKTFVLVTHDVFEAVRLGHRIAVMREGRVVQCAPPRELVRRPADEFVAALLGRHRFQLRLMTARVADALAAPEARGDAGGARAVELPGGASVWEALEALEASGAALVRVADAPSPRYLPREALLAAARD